MSRARDLADSADKDVTGTLTTDGLTVAGNVSVDGGTIKLDGNYPTGTTNTALGDTALDSVQSGGGLNVAIGQSSLTGVTTGDNNTGVGAYSGITVSTSSDNSYFGAFSGYHQTGTKNTALGYAAMNGAAGQSSGGSNTSAGYNALTQITSGSHNTSVGRDALSAHTTAEGAAALGSLALQSNTTGAYNVGIGYTALRYNTTASNNSAVGYNALGANTTGAENVAVGVAAGDGNQTGANNTFIGAEAGRSCNVNNNTFIGQGSGYHVSGANNTILGRYNGNQSGYDYRTASNHIFLSDGAGVPRLILTDSGDLVVPRVYNATTSNSANVQVDSAGIFRRSTSSRRYKNTITDAAHGLTELLTLRPITYKGNSDGDTIFGGLIAEEVHDAGLTEFVTYNDDNEPDALAYGNMVSLCIKAIQELKTELDEAKARIAALEAE